MVSLAMRTAPAASRRLTTSASSSKVWFSKPAAPQVVGIAFDGEEVFGSPGDAVERAAVVAGGEFAVGGGGLREGALFGEGDDEVQRGVVALEAREVELGELDGGELAVAKKLAELADGGEGDLLFL